MLRATLVIAARNLRARSRDRSALLVAFVAPLVLAGILSTALGGSGGFEPTVAVAGDSEQAGQLAEEVLGGPDLSAVVTVLRVADARAARTAVAEEEANAAIVVPDDLGERLRAGDAVRLDVVRAADSPLAGDLAEGVASSFAARLSVAQSSVALALEEGASVAQLPQIAGAALGQPPAMELAAGDVEVVQANAASYFGPAMGVFFVFFVVALGPATLLRERREGTLARIHAAPVPTLAVLAGTALAVGAMAMASLVTLWAATTLLFDANWGHPLGVVAIFVVLVLAVSGVAGLIATAARTDEQVDGLTSIAAFVLALLGGSFGDVGGLPPPWDGLAQFTPNGWALRGFVDLSAGAAPGDILLPLVAILAFAALTLGIAAPRASRLVGR
ncbi:MAG: ABC transporter permease [Euzebyales bacterium]|nr:ABC transporter permease [Euzebyales bacterium]